MPAPPLLWADDDDGDKPPIDSSQAPDLADSAEHMPTRYETKLLGIAIIV
jgi:hypothetical protein